MWVMCVTSELTRTMSVMLLLSFILWVSRSCVNLLVPTLITSHSFTPGLKPTCHTNPFHCLPSSVLPESYTVVMPLTLILILSVSHHPLTHSRLKPSFFLLIFPTVAFLFFVWQVGFSPSWLTPWISRTVYRHFWAYPFLLWSFFSIFLFLVLCCVR